MAQTATYKDLSDLRVLLERGDLAPDRGDEAAREIATVYQAPAVAPRRDIGELLAELEGASAALESVARRDAARPAAARGRGWRRTARRRPGAL